MLQMKKCEDELHTLRAMYSADRVLPQQVSLKYTSGSDQGSCDVTVLAIVNSVNKSL